jgi:DNA-binding MarR family transcriptional regulator
MDTDRLNVLFRVWLASRAAMYLVDDALKSSELDGDEFAIYSMVATAPGITPTDLAQWMAAPATTVSSFVKRLESRGHTERIANPADRRSYGIRLTPDGKRAHKSAAALFEPALDQLVGALGDDHTNVRDGLLHLRRAIDDVRRPKAGDDTQ